MVAHNPSTWESEADGPLSSAPAQYRATSITTTKIIKKFVFLNFIVELYFLNLNNSFVNITMIFRVILV